MIDYKRADRYEKVDWIRKRYGRQYKRLGNLLSRLAGQIPADEFTKIYEYICDEWDICRDQTERDKKRKEKRDARDN